MYISSFLGPIYKRGKKKHNDHTSQLQESRAHKENQEKALFLLHLIMSGSQHGRAQHDKQ